MTRVAGLPSLAPDRSRDPFPPIEACPPTTRRARVEGRSKQTVRFDDEQAATLRTLLPLLEPHWARIVDRFYERIFADPRAHAAMNPRAEQVDRLKAALVEWVRSGLEGPHDEEFTAHRARVGLAHVRIGLPRHSMVAAIHGMRLDIRELLASEISDRGRLLDVCAIVDRFLDTELATLLQAYEADSEEKLRRRERLATIGQLAATIGHDLRHPFGVIESSLFIMRKQASGDARWLAHIDKIARQVDTCKRIVSDLLDPARSNNTQRTHVEIRPVLEEAVALVPIPRQIDLSIDAPDSLTCALDSGLIQRAIINLVTNSIRAIGDREGRVQLQARCEEKPVRMLWLSVLDDGPGFPPSMIPLSFEPLITTHAQGSGLGLAMVKSVAARHGGEVRGANLPDRGARVDLFLPIEVSEPTA